MGYKHYQQIVNITINKTTPKNKITKIRSNLPTKKTRSKSGCLTCRKRKKKCDEDVVNGKCQACTRNFLCCNWNHDSTAKTSNQSDSYSPTLNLQPKIDKVDIRSLCNDEVIVAKVDNDQDLNNNSEPTVINPYPSPLPSPRMESKIMINDMKPIILSDKHIDNKNMFIITSVDNNKRLVNI